MLKHWRLVLFGIVQVQCAACKRDVYPGKDFSWGWFLLFHIPYLVYYLCFKPARTCPSCDADVYAGTWPR